MGKEKESWLEKWLENLAAILVFGGLLWMLVSLGLLLIKFVNFVDSGYLIGWGFLAVGCGLFIVLITSILKEGRR